MLRHMRRALIAGVGAALAGGLLAVVVSAHTTSYESNVNINAFTSGVVGNYFYGAVTSPKPACAPKRKVRVLRKKPGDDSRFGSDTSLEGPSPGSGPYTVTAPTGDIPEGDYYAKVKPRDLAGGKAHTHLCKGAESSALAVGP